MCLLNKFLPALRNISSLPTSPEIRVYKYYMKFILSRTYLFRYFIKSAGIDAELHSRRLAYIARSLAATANDGVKNLRN